MTTDEPHVYTNNSKIAAPHINYTKPYAYDAALVDGWQMTKIKSSLDPISSQLITNKTHNKKTRISRTQMSHPNMDASDRVVTSSPKRQRWHKQ